MAEVRQPSNSLPSAKPAPLSRDADAFGSLTTNAIRKGQSSHANGLSKYTESSTFQTTYQPQDLHNILTPERSSSRSTQVLSGPTRFFNSNHVVDEPIENLGINTATTVTTTITDIHQGLPHNNSTFIPFLTREKQILPQSASSQNKRTYQYQLPKFIDTHVQESDVMPTANDDDDGFPAVTIERNRLPVFARFPFDVTFLPRPMDTNVEDNIHKLRLRLIDSELDHQRRSSDEYLRRTQDQFSFSSSNPTRHYLNNVRSPNDLTYQQLKPQILSRQPSYSRLSIRTPMTIDRLGMDNDLNIPSDIERDLEIRRIQDSLNSGRQSNHQLTVANYSYDPRLHLEPIYERQYSSSNMDDLIDSMARRQLANRRLLEATSSQQRYSAAAYGPYFDSSSIGRRASLRSQQRNDGIFLRDLSSRSRTQNNFIGTYARETSQVFPHRVDHYNPLHADLDSLGPSTLVRANTFSKLPPITSRIDTNRSQNPTNASLYPPNQSYQGRQNYQPPPPLPKNPSEQNEHMIELPSDIFLTSRTDEVGSSRQQPQKRKAKPRSVSRDRSDTLADSESDRSVGEINITPKSNQRISQRDKHLENGNQGFFTEGSSIPDKVKNKDRHRKLFRRAAIGILFLYVLKRRAAKGRLNRSIQTLSATIHKIRLQEIMVALHRVYLEPDGPIYNALMKAIQSPVDLKQALNSSAQQHSEAINIIGEALKDIISRIVDFMPKDGVLGTSKSSAVAALIQNRNSFPENYFWECEKELLEFENSKIINITKQRAMLLILGAFIFRGLVGTLLLKPVKYRLILGELTPKQSSTLKVLATIILYVGRRAVKSIPQILRVPDECALSLYTDANMDPIIQHSQIKPIITKCELSLRVWCEGYISQIDASFGKELRT